MPETSPPRMASGTSSACESLKDRKAANRLCRFPLSWPPAARPGAELFNSIHQVCGSSPEVPSRQLRLWVQPRTRHRRPARLALATAVWPQLAGGWEESAPSCGSEHPCRSEKDAGRVRRLWCVPQRAGDFLYFNIQIRLFFPLRRKPYKGDVTCHFQT